MRGAIGTSTLHTSAAIALAAWAASLAASAVAQDTGTVSSYQLPDPSRTPTPRVQGPVDPDNPYSVPSIAPKIEPTTAPASGPAPRVNIPAPVQSASPAAPTQRQPSGRPAAAASDTPQATATATPRETPAPVPSASAVAAEPTPESSPTASTDTPPSAGTSTSWLVPGLIGGAAVLAIAAFLLLRRRRSPDVEDNEPLAEAPPTRPLPPAMPTPRPQPDARPATVPPTAIAEPLPIATRFTAQAVRLSLVYVTLQYELEIANTGSADLSDLQVRADLASAHASLGTREQLAPAPEQLEAKHTLAALAAGETATLKGEVRMALPQVVPVAKGSGRFFVPLVRFAILAADGSAVRRVFTAGSRDPGSGAIASVRLDAGPRNLRDLDAREIEAARGFALDPMVAHS